MQAPLSLVKENPHIPAQIEVLDKLELQSFRTNSIELDSEPGHEPVSKDNIESEASELETTAVLEPNLRFKAFAAELASANGSTLSQLEYGIHWLYQ